MGAKAEKVIRELFAAFTDNPGLLPPQYQAMIGDAPSDAAAVARTVADYVSGMTDRYALREYRRMFDPLERV